MADEMGSGINQEKVKEATAILKEILLATKKFADLFNALNRPEKSVAGGLIIALSCPWENIDVDGILAGVEWVQFLHGRLTFKINNPPQKPQAITPVIVQPGKN